MEKRGQATLFVIVAIFIIVTVVVVFFIWGNKKVSDISSIESEQIPALAPKFTHQSTQGSIK